MGEAGLSSMDREAGILLEDCAREMDSSQLGPPSESGEGMVLVAAGTTVAAVLVEDALDVDDEEDVDPAAESRAKDCTYAGIPC
jgi:hypothetical protein